MDTIKQVDMKEKICWIDVTLWDGHIDADSVLSGIFLCISSFLVEKVQD